MESSNVEKLIKACNEAKQRAYCPYSNIRVGAALLCEDDTIVQGCNVENACHALGWCAERTALVAAVSRGYRRFKAIAVTSDIIDKPITPCGACRQFMSEFGTDYPVYMVKADLTYTMMKVKDLLPLAFGPDDLKLARTNQQ